MHEPSGRPSSASPVRHVFFSIKGGVGRSTALSVVATDMAQRGFKALVIDLDLEAPGIGNMLLRPTELPLYGMLDAYVESNIAPLDDAFLREMVSASSFGGGRGLLDVVPAVGLISQRYPADVLGKIARAYLEGVDTDGRVTSFLDRTSQLVERLSSMKSYDAVLVDARAGLNESTAAALLGLGAQVLLFGENTPQTFAGYRYLLSHLARFERHEQDDWLDRLRMVHAKASADVVEQQAFRDRAYDVFQELLYHDAPLDVSDPDTSVVLPEYSVDAVEAPHYAWPVLRDANFFSFDPLTAPPQLTAGLYENSYSALLSGLGLNQDE
ncbi:MAG: KGGVGR-motif variant AAA ATPase [Burkholderiaceae bacterium]